MSLTLIFKQKERLPYGDKSRGKFIPPEKGRRAIFVPSFGALEKEEVDYTVEAAQEQEDERIRKGGISESKAKLEAVANIMRQAPERERAKAGREAMKELGGRDVRK